MLQDRIEAALDEGLAPSGLPGAVAAAVAGPEAAQASAGVRGGDTGQAMSADTVFWVASMTKAITSVVALQLAGEGRIGLDAPIGRWVPQLAAPQVLEGFEDDGAPRMRPARGEVTLRHLLTHTSGLGYGFASLELGRWLEATGGDVMGSGPVASLPLLFDPGTGWAYGHGTDYAGLALAEATGAGLEELYAERVFAPLGMADTAFALSDAQKGRLAPMHMRLPDGGVTPIPFALPEPPYLQMAGGGLYSTAGDYLRFLQALLDGPGGALGLTPELYDLLTRSQFTEPRPGAFKSSAPHLSNDFDAFPGRPTGWSLGFLVNVEPGPAGRSAGSLAWAGLSNCYYWLDLQARTAGVMLAQLLPFGDAGALGLFERFERAVYAG